MSVRVALLLIAGVASGLVSVQPAAAVEAESRHVTVASTQMNGWTPDQFNCAGAITGGQSFESAAETLPPAAAPDGAGSYQMQVGANGATLQEVRQARYDGKRLADLTVLKYSSFIDTGNPGPVSEAAPYLLLRVDKNGDGDFTYTEAPSEDDLLIYAPANNKSEADQVPTAGIWQRWNLTASTARFTANGDPGILGLFNLATYQAANPAARLIGTFAGGSLGIRVGCPAPANTTVNIDSVRVAFAVTEVGRTDDTLFNFEPAPNPAETQEGPGSFRFSAATYSGVEGSSGVLITVERTGGAVGTVSVGYTTANGSAQAGSDYTPTSGRLTFTNNETTKSFVVPLVDDTVSEPAEDFLVSLNTPSGGATIGSPSSASVTVTDNDAGTSTGSFRFTSATSTVDEQAGTVTLTVERTTNTTSAATVQYATANGTAVAGTDYTTTSGTLTFAAGELRRTFTVPVLNDQAAESDETFTVTLSNPSVGQLSSPSAAIVTIRDDDTDQVRRIAGPNRFETAIAASRDSFGDGGAGSVVLSRATEFADALAGTPLAHSLNAPLLLTSTGALESAVEAEIQRVLPTGRTVRLLGGTAAIGVAVENRLKQLGYTVVRHAGVDRFETAVLVANALGNPNTLFLATGRNFVDALPGGAAASKVGGAVLLTEDRTMNARTRAYISAHPNAKRYALGGPAAAADPAATPIIGNDRYDTAVKVANTFFSSPIRVGLVSGEQFFDSLAGGAHISRAGGPLLLTRQATLPEVVGSYLSGNKASIAIAFIYGGSAAVSDQVERDVLTAIR